jgi:hypothetical protein
MQKNMSTRTLERRYMYVYVYMYHASYVFFAFEGISMCIYERKYAYTYVCILSCPVFFAFALTRTLERRYMYVYVCIMHVCMYHAFPVFFACALTRTLERRYTYLYLCIMKGCRCRKICGLEHWRDGIRTCIYELPFS